MPNRLHIATFIIFSIYLCSGLAAAADAKIKNCLEQVATLNIQKEIVLENGGLWSSFSQSKEVRSHSSEGLQLDNIETIVYLASATKESLRRIL